MIILAYLFVIISSSFWLTISTFLSSLFDLILFWLPNKFRIPIVSFFSGILGSLLSILSSKLIFYWLIGAKSFGLAPYLAAVLPLFIPISNDYKKYQELKQVQNNSDDVVKELFSSSTSGMKVFSIGAIFGIFIGVLFLL